MRIKPYYSDGRIEIYHGDCLEVMSELSSTVDMVLADPPYGTTACAWDSIIPLEPMWERLKRVIKPNGAIVMTASQPFTTSLISSNMEMFKYCWVWDKGKAGNFATAKYRPLTVTEDILLFCGDTTAYFPQMTMAKQHNIRPRDTAKTYAYKKGSALKIGSSHSTSHNEGIRYPTNLIHIKATLGDCNNKNRLHPTQKPVALMEYIIKTYTNEDETILDFAMGSGTTLVAAKNLNRKAIGIETEEKYCEIAVKRLAQNVFAFSDTTEDVEGHVNAH